jgi:hypothetical protein
MYGSSLSLFYQKSFGKEKTIFKYRRINSAADKTKPAEAG